MRLVAVAIQEAGRFGESLLHGNSHQPPLPPANSAVLEAGDLGKASFTATASSRHCPGEQCRPGGGRLGESLPHGNSHQPPLPGKQCRRALRCYRARSSHFRSAWR